MDIYDAKNIKPMLIANMIEPFDDPDYLYELKLDGERCIAYLDKAETELRNKRNIRMLPKFPELSGIHKQSKVKSILDGELIVVKSGKPDFSEVQRRSITSNQFKRNILSKQIPASFIAYDILYYKEKQVTELPLLERKSLLDNLLEEETNKLALSRYTVGKGVSLYNLTVEQNLEGIVAKRIDSKYYFGKSTKDWVKIKNLQDDDYVICGYVPKDKGITRIILGQYSDNMLIYKGHVAVGTASPSFIEILSVPLCDERPGFPNDENAIWIEPRLVCVVKYMTKTINGGLRQPSLKGLRFDKEPSQCIET